MKKILLVITKSNWGGAQKYVYDIATNLEEQGFEPVVACGGKEEMATRLQEKGIRVIPLSKLKNNLNPLGTILAFWELTRIYRHEKPDVVHVNSSKVGLMGTIAGRIVGVRKIVFTAHGWPFNEERPLWQKGLLRFLMKLTVLCSHTTIVVSHKTLEDLYPSPRLRKKCRVVYNGISPIPFKPPTSFYEDMHTMRRERVAMVSIGELHPSKGFDLALEYLKELQDLSWEWFILGEGRSRGQLETLIQKHDLASRVHLIGHTKNAAIYLESFDLFFLPSRTEALAYVAIEALQSSLPIIASNVGGIPEVLSKDPGTRLIDMRAQRTEGILREIVSHPPQKITTGREELRQEFSLERMIEKTIEVYKN